MAITTTPPTTEPAIIPPIGVDEPLSGDGVGVGAGEVEVGEEELDEIVVVEKVVDCAEEEVLVVVGLYGRAPNGT